MLKHENGYELGSQESKGDEGDIRHENPMIVYEPKAHFENQKIGFSLIYDLDTPVRTRSQTLFFDWFS